MRRTDNKDKHCFMGDAGLPEMAASLDNIYKKVDREGFDQDISEEDALTLASRYDFSGGNIENIARKAAVGYVLSGEKARLQDLLKYCDEETLSTAKGTKRIGF